MGKRKDLQGTQQVKAWYMKRCCVWVLEASLKDNEHQKENYKNILSSVSVKE